MSQFDPAFHFMLPHEGGYADDPSDRGGQTKFGISKRQYPNEDIRNLTLDEARAIYERDYWKPFPYDNILSQPIANKVFDMTVNMGAKQSHRVLQGSCCDCGELVNCDGEFGALTLAAVNACEPDSLLSAIRTRQQAFYYQLAAQRASDAKFLPSWLKRARA